MRLWVRGAVCSSSLPTLGHLPNALKDKEPESSLRDTVCPVAQSPGSLAPEASDQEHFRDITVYSLSKKLKHLMKTPSFMFRINT